MADIRPTSFTVYPDGYADLVHSDRDLWTLTIDLVGERGDRWAVRRFGSRYDRLGCIAPEPIPSSRDDHYLERHQFTLDEAKALASRLVADLRVNGLTAREASDFVASRPNTGGPLTDPSSTHPELEGRPVMIGDVLEAPHPDDPTITTVGFHVGSISWHPGGLYPAGWVVAPTDREYAVALPYEWPLTECRRVHPDAQPTSADPLAELRDFHEQLEPFDPEQRRRPIGQWPLTADDVIGLSNLLTTRGLRLVHIPEASDEIELTIDRLRSFDQVLADDPTYSHSAGRRYIRRAARILDNEHGQVV